eukprot:scaffold105582_cov22-Tisochrysis_lutea.AAC.1
MKPAMPLNICNASTPSIHTIDESTRQASSHQRSEETDELLSISLCAAEGDQEKGSISGSRDVQTPARHAPFSAFLTDAISDGQETHEGPHLRLAWRPAEKQADALNESYH